MNRLVILANKNAKNRYIFAPNFENNRSHRGYNSCWLLAVSPQKSPKPIAKSQSKKNTAMKQLTIQIITAALMSLGGLALLFCGVCIAPHGEIHESLLIGFGEVATFAGALFGIDAAYAKRLWDITNSFAKKQKEKPSEAPSTRSNTAILALPEHTESTSQK